MARVNPKDKGVEVWNPPKEKEESSTTQTSLSPDTQKDVPTLPVPGGMTLRSGDFFSPNYVKGVRGWKMFENGDFEINGIITLRGEAISSKSLSTFSSVELTAASETIDVSDLGSGTIMDVIIYITGMSAVTQIKIQFNGDTGANYASKAFTDYAAGAASMGDTSSFLSNAGDSGDRTIILSLTNSSLIMKRGSWSSAQGGGVILPYLYSGVIAWNNLTDPITSIRILNLAAGATFGAGSKISVLTS